MNVRVLSPVHREIVETANYLEQQAGLGADFLKVVYSQLDSIEAEPESFPLWELNPLNVEIRRVLLQRFRYIIYFQIVRDEIIILAISHGSRDYDTWLNRVQRSKAWPDQRNDHSSGGDES